MSFSALGIAGGIANFVVADPRTSICLAIHFLTIPAVTSRTA